MPVKRNLTWYYYCTGELPLAVNKHTLSIGNWCLHTACGEYEIAAINIDFVVDKYPINFEVYIEPQGEYLVIETEIDDQLKEDANQYKNLWLDTKEALIFTGKAEKNKEIVVDMIIEEVTNA